MTYYYMTSSKGRAGSASITWHRGEFESKAEIRRQYKMRSTVVKYIMTEEEFRSHYGTSLDNRVQAY